MLENLNTRTKSIVSKLIREESVEVGIKTVGPFDEEERLLLYAVASNLTVLSPLGGDNLAEKVTKLIDASTLPEFEAQPREATDEGNGKSWRIANIGAFSFRGLAPANHVWEFNFDSESHLLYGPNGCGKSSLLGAVAWCLTGNIFRDDCPPGNPTAIDVFTVGNTPKKADPRPDALSLLDETGASISATSVFWVSIQLKRKDTTGIEEVMWLKRSNESGLTMSLNGSDWQRIPDLASVGISELDTELRILMPARVPHLQFGDNPDLARLFSQIIGLDDLASIAATGEASSRALRSRATRLENGELLAQNQRIEAAVDDIKNAATIEIEAWPEFEKAVGSSRTLDEVKKFGEKSKEAMSLWQEQLVEDIGLVMPSRDNAEYAEFKSQLEQLPGRVQASIDSLSQPINELFTNSFGIALLAKDEIENKVQELTEFTTLATAKIRERLEWALKEKAEPHSKLMLIASGCYLQEDDTCPVCTQSLSEVPTTRDQLMELKPFSSLSHLNKDIDDLERELIADLNSIVDKEKRVESGVSLEFRIVEDWQNLKKVAFNDLLEPIAERFDERVVEIASMARFSSKANKDSICGSLEDQFPEKFISLSAEIELARKHLGIAGVIHRQSTQIKGLPRKAAFFRN